MLRAIREIKPTYIVGENVYGLLNWDGGLVFNEVQNDLENEGYEIQPVILPACGVGAPHKRERIWFVAYNANARVESLRQKRQDSIYEFGITTNANGTSTIDPIQTRRDLLTSETNTNSESQQGNNIDREHCKQKQREPGGMGIETNVFTNPERFGQQEQGKPERPMYSKENREWKASWAYNDGRWPTQSPVCGRNDGIPYRVDRLKALGNAIVPQVALQIFKAINMHRASLSGV